MFYEFRQSNSGGIFLDPAVAVVIEADDANEANDIALANGLYFNGCRTGDDCSCCGDRWHRVDEWDETDLTDEDATINRDGVPLRKIIRKGAGK